MAFLAGGRKVSNNLRPLSLPALELPEPVRYVKRTTPSITRDEVERYLYPLHCRGWTVLKTRDPSKQWPNTGRVPLIKSENRRSPSEVALVSGVAVVAVRLGLSFLCLSH